MSIPTDEVVASGSLTNSESNGGQEGQLQLLLEIIDTLPHEKLVTLAQQMCRKFPVARIFAENELAVLSEQVPAITNSTAGNPKSEKTVVEHKVVPKFATCKNCNAHYNATENKEGVCCFHPGMQLIYLITDSILTFVGEKNVDDEGNFWDQFDWEDWRDGE